MSEPRCHTDALERLKAFGFSVGRIISVEPEAVLYIDELGHPYTAWAFLVEGEIVYRSEPGFASEPDPLLVP